MNFLKPYTKNGTKLVKSISNKKRIDKTEHVHPVETVKSVQFWSWFRPEMARKNGAYPFNLGKNGRKTEYIRSPVRACGLKRVETTRKRSMSVHSTKSKCLTINSERLKNGANPFTIVVNDKNGPYPFTHLTSFSYLCVKESNSKTHCYGR